MLSLFMIFTERFEFSTYGKEYEGSYIVVRLFSRLESIEYVKNIANFGKARVEGEDIMENAEDVVNYAYEAVKSQFVEGVKLEDGKTQEMKANDVLDLPPKVIGDIVNVIRGMPIKKN